MLCKAGKMKTRSDQTVFNLHNVMPGIDARPAHNCETASNNFYIDKLYHVKIVADAWIHYTWIGSRYLQM